LRLLDYILPLILKILLFLKNNYKKKKPFSKSQRAGKVRLPRQDDYRTFCMSEKTEKMYRKLEEVIEVY